MIITFLEEFVRKIGKIVNSSETQSKNSFGCQINLSRNNHQDGNSISYERECRLSNEPFNDEDFILNWTQKLKTPTTIYQSSDPLFC